MNRNRTDSAFQMGLCLLTLAAVALPAFSQPAAVIAPTPNLVVENIPPIPRALAAEVRPYTEFRTANPADWHPTARELLVTTRFGNTAQVHRVRMPMGARTQLTFFSEPIGQTLYEPRDGKHFLFTKDVGGNEFSQIYRYDFADGRVTLLTDGGRSQNGGMRWNPAGDRIAYASTRRNGADRDIYTLNPLDPKSDRLVLKVTGGGWSVGDWSPDGRRLLVEELISGSETRLWLIDGESGQKTLLTEPARGVASYRHAQFDHTGTAVYFTTDKNDEFHRLCRFDLNTRELKPLIESIPWDIELMQVSPDRRRIALTANEAGISRLYVYHLERASLEPIQAPADAVISDIVWHRNSREFGFSVASARSPADVYSYDIVSRQLTRWTESEMGGLVASELSEPQLIKWPSFDGREISGFLYRPPARFTGRRPVLIQIHGGPESQARPTFLGRNNYFLNELGMAIIFPNVRGSEGYGKTFLQLDNALHREDAVKDISALLDWVARQPQLDASRVVVAGGSYGGYMTLAVSFHEAKRIRCSVDVVGISNFNTFLKNTESYRRDLRRAEYGDERKPEIHDFFERIAPLNNADKITKPLFVIQGGNDPRVPHTEAEQIAQRVRENGTPVWFLMAKDEGHGFRKKENADFQFYATILFLREHLLAGARSEADAG